MNVPKSLLPPLIVAIFGLAMIVQSVSGLRCYTGGGAGAAAIYVPHDCKADHTLCEFKNTTVAGVTMKLAQGCAMPSMDRKPVRGLILEQLNHETMKY